MPKKAVAVLLKNRRNSYVFLHGELKDELKQLRRDMSMQNGQEFLLSITIAVDDMTRHVHMFPKVFFMDVIANTNRQKHDLFLMVVKDLAGECFIGNATLLPCGQLWVFTKFYCYFFYQLYGTVTVSHLRLALMDGDSASHGSFDAATHGMACYANAKHILCMFHAVVLQFNDTVYGKLPKIKGTRTLTASAALYGMYRSRLRPFPHVVKSTYSWIACQLEVGTLVINFAVEARFQILLDSSAQTTRGNVLDFFVKPKNGLV